MKHFVQRREKIEAPHRRVLKVGLLAAAAAMATACQGEVGDDGLMAPDGLAGGTVPGASGATQTPGGAAAPGAAGTVPGAGGVVPADGQPPAGGDPATSPTAPADGSSPAQPIGPAPVTEPVPFEPPAGMLRRLTRLQFRNAIRDVFGTEVDIQALDGDIQTDDFATIGASTVLTSARGVEQYQAAIEAAVDEVFADPTRRNEFLGCALTDAGDPSCVRSFIENMGRTAWRRPLDSVEVDRIVAIVDDATPDLGAIEGVRWATVALFNSPNFIYRPELGTVAPDGSLRLMGYELASRLAFLLWNSLPDETLLDEAQSGALDTPEGLRSAATRMLDAPSGRASVGAFAEEYMRLDRIAVQAKDAELYPEYSPALQEAAVKDMRGVWESVVFDDRASALSLFTTTKVIVNSELAELYGLDATGLTPETFEERELPAGGVRLGILGKVGFLSQFANQKFGSPTLRGKFMRQSLMCTKVPPPPEDAVPQLPEASPDTPMTRRQQLDLHREDPACAACHALMDPLGLPFESFDAIGRYRTMEQGLPIDPSGEFDGTAVADSTELGAVLESSELVSDCLVRKFYSYAVGHEQRSVDASVIADLKQSFSTSGYQLRDLILDIVMHDAFTAVAPQAE